MSSCYKAKGRRRSGVGRVVSISGLIALTGLLFFMVLPGAGDQQREERKHMGSNARDALHQGTRNGMETVSGIDSLFEREDAYFSHIHGIGYSRDGKQIIVPAHYGISIYEEGRWSVPASPGHDYMGFAATDEGFYSSGHPSLMSGLSNPLGIVKVSGSGGKLTSLAFSGEIDFHVVAAGYYSHAVYVLNDTRSSSIPSGLHYTRDEGKSWRQSRLEGVPREITQLAAHPSDPGLVAAAAFGGLFLSTDFGNTFRRLPTGFDASAVSFHPDGMLLFYGGRGLAALRFPELSKVAVPPPPISKGDSISYIASSPSRIEEIVVVTREKDIYLSRDQGRHWTQIARKGLAI